MIQIRDRQALQLPFAAGALVRFSGVIRLQRRYFAIRYPTLRENLLRDLAGHIGEAEVTTGVAVGELLVIEPHEGKQRRQLGIGWPCPCKRQPWSGNHAAANPQT